MAKPSLPWESSQPRRRANRNSKPLPFEDVEPIASPGYIDPQDAEIVTGVDFNALAKQQDADLSKQRRQSEVDAKAAQRAAEQQAAANIKQERAAREADYRSKGVKFFTDATGEIRPVTDESGAVQYEPKKGETQYDEKGALRIDRTATGEQKVIRPDANAPIGDDPNDPHSPYLYRKNKETSWETIDPKEGIKSNDPKVKIASARKLHKLTLKQLEDERLDSMSELLDLSAQQQNPDLPKLDDKEREKLQKTISDYSQPSEPLRKGASQEEIDQWNSAEEARKNKLDEANLQLARGDSRLNLDRNRFEALTKHKEVVARLNAAKKKTPADYLNSAQEKPLEQRTQETQAAVEGVQKSAADIATRQQALQDEAEKDRQDFESAGVPAGDIPVHVKYTDANGQKVDKIVGQQAYAEFQIRESKRKQKLALLEEKGSEVEANRQQVSQQVDQINADIAKQNERAQEQAVIAPQIISESNALPSSSSGKFVTDKSGSLFRYTGEAVRQGRSSLPKNTEQIARKSGDVMLVSKASNLVPASQLSESQVYLETQETRKADELRRQAQEMTGKGRAASQQQQKLIQRAKELESGVRRVTAEEADAQTTAVADSVKSLRDDLTAKASHIEDLAKAGVFTPEQARGERESVIKNRIDQFQADVGQKLTEAREAVLSGRMSIQQANQVFAAAGIQPKIIPDIDAQLSKSTWSEKAKLISGFEKDYSGQAAYNPIEQIARAGALEQTIQSTLENERFLEDRSKLKAKTDREAALEWLDANPSAGDQFENGLRSIRQGINSYIPSAARLLADARVRVLYRDKNLSGEEYNKLIQQQPTYQFAKDFEASDSEGSDPRLAGHWSGTVGQGIGSALQFAALGYLTAGAGTAIGLGARGALMLQRAAVMTSGGLMETDSIQQKVREMGGDPGLVSYVIGTGLGATELFGATESMEKVMFGGTKSMQDYVFKLVSAQSVKRIAWQTVEESAQEVSQGIGELLTTGKFYDDLKDAFKRDNPIATDADFEKKYGKRPEAIDGMADSIIGAGPVGALFEAISLTTGKMRYVRARDKAVAQRRSAAQSYADAVSQFTPQLAAENYNAQMQSSGAKVPPITAQDVTKALQLSAPFGQGPQIQQIEEAQQRLTERLAEAEKTGSADDVVSINQALAILEEYKTNVAHGTLNSAIGAETELTEVEADSKQQIADLTTKLQDVQQMAAAGDPGAIAALPSLQQQIGMAQAHINATGVARAVTRVAQGATEDQLTVEDKAALAQPDPTGLPRVEWVNGVGVIAQPTLNRLNQLFPKLSPLLPKSETEQRQNLQQKGATDERQQKRRQEKGLLTQPASETSRGAESIPSPAAASSSPSNETTSNQPQSQTEDVPPGSAQVQSGTAQSDQKASQPNSSSPTGIGAGIGESIQKRFQPLIDRQSTPRVKVALQKAVDALIPQLDVYGQAFPKINTDARHSRGGGLAYNPQTKELEIDLGRLASQLNGVKDPAKLVQVTIQEELIHRAATDALTPDEVSKLWEMLPDGLKKTVRDAYYSAIVQRGEAMPADDAFKLGHEFLRMLTQDDFFKQVTESTEVSPNLIDYLRELLEKIGQTLRSMLADPALTSEEARKAVQEAENAISARLLELGVQKESQRQEPPPEKKTLTQGEVWAKSPITVRIRALSKILTNQGIAQDVAESVARDFDSKNAGVALNTAREALIQHFRDLGGVFPRESAAANFNPDPEFWKRSGYSDEEATTFAENADAQRQVAELEASDANAKVRDALLQKSVDATQSAESVQGNEQSRGTSASVDQVGDGAGSGDGNGTAPSGPGAILETGKSQLVESGSAASPAASPAGESGAVGTPDFEGQAVIGSRGIAYTDQNEPIEFDWAVVDGSGLTASNLPDGRINPAYPQELQPRDRTSAASRAQVNEIASNTNFARLSDAATVNDGAPVVGSDGVVESGNGRIMGLSTAYQEGRPNVSTYKQDLITNAARYGLDPAKIERMAAPVLIRVRRTDVDRLSFVQRANVGNVAPMRETEVAKTDSKRLIASPGMLQGLVFDENGEFKPERNADFVQGFINGVPQNERPAMIDARGNLSQTGLRRIRNALFASAFGTSDAANRVLARLTEAIDADGKNLTNGLMSAAPAFAEQNGLIAQGAAYPVSIADDLVSAAQAWNDLRARGENVADYLAQGQLVSDGLTPFQKQILEWIDANKRSAKRIGASLRAYADAVRMAGDPRQIGLLGGNEAPTKEALWNLATREQTLFSGERSNDAALTPSQRRSYLKAYNKLFALQRAGTVLNASQQALFDQAEKALGQELLFDVEASNERQREAERRAVQAGLERRLIGEPIQTQDSFLPTPGQQTLFAGERTNEFKSKLKPEFLKAIEDEESKVYPGSLKVDKQPGLTEEERALEALCAQRIQEDVNKSFAKYMADHKGKWVINADDVRMHFPEYAESLESKSKWAKAVHEPSSAFAKEVYRRALNAPNDTVVMLSGGGGSGKTTVQEAAIAQGYQAYDGTFSNFSGAEKKIDQALAAGKKVSVSYVHRPFLKAVEGILDRAIRIGRTVSIDQAAKDHVGAQRSFLSLLDRYKNNPSVSFQMFDNSGAKEDIHEVPVDEINSKLYRNSDEIARQAHEWLREEQRRRTANRSPIPAQTYDSLQGSDSGLESDRRRRDSGRSGEAGTDQEDGSDVRLSSGERATGQLNLFYFLTPDQQIEVQQRPSVSTGKPVQPSLNLGTYRNPGELDFSKQAKSPNDLIRENIGLATSIASGYDNIPGIERNDAIQEARKTLVEAARKFDISRGNNFSAYAATAVRNRLNSLYERQIRIARREEMNLNETVSEDGSMTRLDQTPDTTAGRSLPVESQETQRVLDRIVDSFPDRPRNIVRGFMAGKSGEQMAQELGISRQAINASLHGSLEILRQRLKREGFRGQDGGVLYSGERDIDPNSVTFELDDAPIYVRKNLDESDPSTWAIPQDLVDKLDEAPYNITKTDLIDDGSWFESVLPEKDNARLEELRYEFDSDGKIGIDNDNESHEMRDKIEAMSDISREDPLYKSAESFDKTITQEIRSLLNKGVEIVDRAQRVKSEIFKRAQEWIASPLRDIEAFESDPDEPSNWPSPIQEEFEALPEDAISWNNQSKTWSNPQLFDEYKQRAQRRINELKSQTPVTQPTLFAGERPGDEEFPTLEELYAALNDTLPSQQEVEEWNRAAAAEPVGERTIGVPRKANYAEDAATRRNIDVVQYLREQEMKRETEQQWIDAGRQMVEQDQEGVKRRLLETALAGSAIDRPELVKAAQILVPRLMREAYQTGDKARQREAFTLAWAYDAGGSQQGRAFAARRDPFKTPSERHIEFLTKIISTPDAATRKEIEKAGTPQEKMRLLEQAQNERLEKIEKALAAMGITPDDIFASEVNVTLKTATFVKDSVGKLGTLAERNAARMILDGFSDKEISKTVSLPVEYIPTVREKLDKALSEKLAQYVDRGFTAADLENLDVSKLFAGEREVRKVALTPEERAQRIADMLRKIRPDAARANSGKLIRRRRLARKALKAAYDGPTPTGEGIPPYSPMRQPRMDMGDTVPASGEGIPAYTKLQQEEMAYEKMTPWEYVAFDATSPEQTVRAARLMQAATNKNGFDMVYEAWINGILSGPQTHFVNIMGNAANALWDYTIQRPLEGLINTAVGAQKGTQLGELNHLFRGVLPGISEGWQAAARAWSTEHDFFESDKLNSQIEFGTFDKGGNIKASIPGKFGRGVRIPGRALQAMDSFFKYTLGRMEVGAAAFRLGKAQGLTGEKLESFIRDQMAPGSASWQMAVDKARDLTFQTELNPEGLPALISKIRNREPQTLGGKLTNFVLGLIFPFIRTPYNIFRIGLRKSPLGSLNVAKHIAQGLWSLKGGKTFVDGYSKAQMVQDLAEQAIAWGLLALLWGAAEGDDDDDKKQLLITGSRPYGLEKQGERDLLNRTSGGPLQIRIGGRNGVYIPYGRIEPIATVLGITIDALRLAKKRDTTASNFIPRFTAYLMSQASEKTFIQGITGIADTVDSIAHSEYENLAQGWKRKLVAGLVPNLIRQPLRNLDDYVRDSKYAGADYIGTNAGPLAEQSYDIYGKPQEKQGNALTRQFIAYGIQPTPYLKLGDKMLMRWNKYHPESEKDYVPERPKSNFYTLTNRDGYPVPMTASQVAELDRLAGQNFDRSLRGWLTERKAERPTEDDIKQFNKDWADAKKQARETVAAKARATRTTERKLALPWQ